MAVATHHARRIKKSSSDKPASTDKPRGRRPETRSTERSATSTNADKPARTRNPRNTRNSRPAATAMVPELPANRDPEVFLDDAIDNFGNSVDYVSPYQNKGRGRRPNGNAPVGAQARTARPARQERSPGATGTADKRRAPKRVNNNPRRDDARYASPSEPAVNREAPQPLIIRKGERLPSLEQLEQLDSRSRKEKPALLTSRTD